MPALPRVHRIDTRPARSTRHIPAGFDLVGNLQRLCADLVARVPELTHIDLSRVALGTCQTRSSVRHGVQATLTPLRFEGGARECRRRGGTWRIGTLVDATGREMLYALRFFVPRFCEQPPHEKLVTAAHELWHIGPAFDGDLRRFPGRCFAHSSSHKRFNADVDRLVATYLATGPASETLAFLQHDFATLRHRHGAVLGSRIAMPRLTRIAGK